MNRISITIRTLPFIMIFLLLSGCGSRQGGDHLSSWPAGVERVWVGPEYFANRLADWKIDEGRLECVEAAPRFPLRTLFLLTRTLQTGNDSFSMRVRTGAIEANRSPSAESFTGFLIGGGGDHVDYRITAWTHHKPAEDGGLLAVIDGSGTIAFRNNSTDIQVGNQWAVSDGLENDTIPILAGGRDASSPIAGGLRAQVILELTGEMVGGMYQLRMTASDEESEEVISEALYVDVPEEYLDGGIALVSHLGPTGSLSGYWFEEWEMSGPKIERHDERLFGPVLTTQYTLSEGVLHLTAQMPPLGLDDVGKVTLDIRKNGRGPWTTADETEWLEDSYIAPFRVEEWDSSRDTPFRVLYELKTGPNEYAASSYEGVIRAEPVDEEFVVAAFTGNKNYTGGLKWNSQGYWFPHSDVIDAVIWHDPDFLFFSGDQVYEGDLTPAIRNPFDKAMLDYLYKWYRWCWAFRDLTRDRPAVTIPDDHDVYHGNIWGAGGKKAEAYEGVTAQDSGGYVMPARFVNAVHQTQTSHLPDPYDPEPSGQGISVYYTDVNYGGVSFAVIADRQWKSSPTVAVPEGQFVNGWPQNSDFDPATEADVPGAVLLGEKQLRFLREWSTDWSNASWMKVVLSQTIFANVATIPSDAMSGSVLPSVPILDRAVYPDNWKKATDGDSNGWPQTGRNSAIREMRRGFALHIAGDQHLGSTIQYGVDDWGDAGFALCVPSVGNTWPRRWFPPETGLNREPGAPEYTGDFFDGFGNRMTVHAVSNPFLTGIEPTNLHDRVPGYGIVHLNRTTREITIECWPRWTDPSEPEAEQYPGWPVTLHQLDNYSREPAGYLPRIVVEGIEDPVVQVIVENTGEIIYSLRISGQSFQPRVFSLEGTYTLFVGDPDLEKGERITGLKAVADRSEVSGLVISF
ncbi:alkaline phosphatase D family protein [Gemmatimonadota bacterium]